MLCKENFTKLQRMKNTQSIKSTAKNNRFHYDDYYEYYTYDIHFFKIRKTGKI